VHKSTEIQLSKNYYFTRYLNSLRFKKNDVILSWSWRHRPRSKWWDQ